MARGNGKSEVDPQELDLEHELPAADDTRRGASRRSSRTTANAGGRDELEKLKAERDTLLDRLARLQAEFENARKRAAREQQEFREYADGRCDQGFAAGPRQLRARLAGTAPNQLNEFRGGVELIYKQLQDALAKLGVRPIPAKGEPFDPHFTRPSKWWTPPKARIIMYSKSCSAATS